jgi:hypothetical protein
MATKKTAHTVTGKIIGVTLLTTGRVLLATENSIYELDGAGIWQPMLIGVPDPVVDEPPPDAAKPGLFGTPHPVTP